MHTILKDEVISVGDLVMVTKPAPCCNSIGDIGVIFKVNSIITNNGKCSYCGKKDESDVALSSDSMFRLVRLKRIPPLSELENTVITVEETV